MTTADDRAVEAALDGAAEACARDGQQLTALRRTVLRLVLQADSPLTAYQLLERLQAIRKAAPPTIYRALDFLIARKLIHKVERLGAFVGCTEHPGHHDHPAQFLICATCGTVAELDDPAVTHALEDAADRAGFRARTAVVELEGVCAACAGAA